MDKLIEKIIEKTELKNWTLFLFIFAICYIFWLHSIEGEWLAVPKTEYPNTTLFLLEVFLSSLTITRILVAIKFLEAVNRTPIIADFINFVVVERRIVRGLCDDILFDKELITGEIGEDQIEYWLAYKDGITNLEAWLLIYNETIVENALPYYNICQKAVIGKTFIECSKKGLATTGYCTITLNPILYRDLDKNEYGGFWIPKRPLCLEHFILIAFLAGAIDLYLVYIYYLPLYFLN